LAIIIPPAREDRKILRVILIAVFVRVLLNVTPVLDRISSGFAIILCSVIAAGGCAWVDTKKRREKAEGMKNGQK
ncbi:MAG: hypothetical protein IJ733_16000, partial [Lachnospiraceae bacterium]|nr:hypothetical protein [Lachnospiraceae bacterium]